MQNSVYVALVALRNVALVGIGYFSGVIVFHLYSII